jgi:dihydrofolate synthase/folylpolyglutamate synthase
LVDFRERIRIDGEMIPEEAVVEFTETYRDEMVRMGLTFFEMATAMGLWWFARAGCDVAIIETGLGGRLDSTNIITPVLSVITNIGLEHTQYLGDTIAAIAAEKAGIIKPGVPVVIGETDPESGPVFIEKAKELNSPIVFADKHFQLSTFNLI